MPCLKMRLNSDPIATQTYVWADPHFKFIKSYARSYIFLTLQVFSVPAIKLLAQPHIYRILSVVTYTIAWYKSNSYRKPFLPVPID